MLEFEKKRPVLIFQTDKLNLAVKEGIYDFFLVIPLSSKKDIVADEFRYKISKREMLQEKIGSLSAKECLEVEAILKNLFKMTP